MGDRSAIEWTDATWNPIRGCSRVSEGCRNCYAERVAARFSGGPALAGRELTNADKPYPPYHGLAVMTKAGPRWTGEVRFVPEVLGAPLRWRTPRRIFVNSMSDLFHEGVEVSWIERIFEVMRVTPRHTYQILTKRPEQMYRVLAEDGWLGADDSAARSRLHRMLPLPNVWLGVSCEDQATADARIPVLLRTPAAVRFVSYEPALAGVDFRRWLYNTSVLSGEPTGGARLDWLIIGGESGPGARRFDLAWARQTVAQCRAAGVQCFVKQLGAWPVNGNAETTIHEGLDATGPVIWPRVKLRDRKGGDPEEWPGDLRGVREFPR